MERVCVSAFFVSSEFESNENDKKRELDEMCEDRDMVELCENVEKTDIFDSEYDQELYEICTMYENLFDSEYDTNLYEICTTIENNVIKEDTMQKTIKERSNTSDEGNDIDKWYCYACHTERCEDMRQCPLCQKWFHEQCLGLTKEDLDFDCPICN
ncbi:hypothetical protein K1T71_012058 [Dendrolimus kikuchii]|uniref:Uncharacterized protein n=1 Tax=Dendrolimus kikuchii TaxID=765133 RepID=A0ACC1CKF3_9NEOP|nr:hypothetical protein K1T71_012058 [Dendrolimus kikuchii]